MRTLPQGTIGSRVPWTHNRTLWLSAGEAVVEVVGETLAAADKVLDVCRGCGGKRGSRSVTARREPASRRTTMTSRSDAACPARVTTYAKNRP